MITLPCGFVDEKGMHIKEVDLGEMTGHEEDMLADPAKNRGSSLMGDLLGRCMNRIGELSVSAKTESERMKRAKTFEPYLKKMLMIDRSFLFIKLRELSLGSEFLFEATCPACNTIHPRMRASLDELKVTEMLQGSGEESDEPIQPRAPSMENGLDLPSGTHVVWRHLIGADESLIQAAKKSSPGTLFSYLLFLRTVSIDGAKPTMNAIKGLSTRDRDAYRHAIDQCEGGVETELELNCTSCGHAWKLELPVTQKSFFFPSGVH